MAARAPFQIATEFYRALGRIGTPESVQALIGVAQSSKGLLSSRKALPRRFASIEGIGLAGSPAALAALRDLMEDRDRYVREAAQAALQTASGR